MENERWCSELHGATQRPSGFELGGSVSYTSSLQECDMFSLRKSKAGTAMRDFSMWELFIMQDVLLLLLAGNS